MNVDNYRHIVNSFIENFKHPLISKIVSDIGVSFLKVRVFLFENYYIYIKIYNKNNVYIVKSELRRLNLDSEVDYDVINKTTIIDNFHMLTVQGVYNLLRKHTTRQLQNFTSIGL